MLGEEQHSDYQDDNLPNDNKSATSYIFLEHQVIPLLVVDGESYEHKGVIDGGKGNLMRCPIFQVELPVFIH